MKLALGYNPKYLEKEIQIPNEAHLVELGISEYLNLKNSEKKFPSLSLHISKSPIVESIAVQDEFIAKICDTVDCEDFISAGFHLTGERFNGIGRLGFSSHYLPSKELEERAIRFLKKFREQSKLETWIENANFYSGSFEEIKNCYQSLNYVANKSQSSLIIDLSHLKIDCGNNKLDPLFFIGLIDWKIVKEIHLSGIVEDKYGVLHDGHSKVVHSSVWKLFENITHLLNENVYINLEHTDPSLAEQDLIEQDIEKLLTIFKRSRLKRTSLDPERYAKGYLAKLLTKWIPGLEDALNEEGINLQKSIDEWIQSLDASGQRLSFSNHEILDSERDRVVEAAHHYLEFIQG